MEQLNRLASLLVAEKGFQPIDPHSDDWNAAAVVDLLAEPPPFGFVGTLARWGRTSIALVDADGLDLAGMDRFAGRFLDLVYWDYSILGASFGTLCFVFARPPAPATIDYIRKLKRSSRHDKAWMAAWTIDLSTSRVMSHRWAPFGLYPGRAYLEGAVRRL